tara:strand:- start:1069 stop:1695 length:627 start_codon:yes stop_codon:yes gene_type:complete
MYSAFQELYIDEVIDSNPMTKVSRFKHIKAEPEPFTTSEREKILAQMTGYVRNLYEFAFWTGLRMSKLLALEQCDIDLERKIVFVRKALVKGKIKGTKTKAGERNHQLHPQALSALKSQLAIIPHDHERIFLNPKTMQPWRDDRQIYNQCWVPSLKKSGIKYRTQYNTRHTYASTMLTENMPIAWVAKQLGHSNATETLKTYARWMSE